MAGFGEIVGRADLTDQIIPTENVNEILKASPAASVMLTRAKQVRMSGKKTRQSVLSTLPDAYWVDGDTGLKQTDNLGFKELTMTAEELAVIVPIPDAVVDDSNVPLWDEVKPLISEAIGRKLDQACLFGIDKPQSWPEGIVPAAIAAGNVAQAGRNGLPDAFLQVAEAASRGGASINGFVTEPGLNWRLRGQKDVNGNFIFGNPSAGGDPTLFGFTLDEVRNGAWDASATAVALDWSKVIIGVRQDVTYDLFSEGVISDASGKVVLNLMQQDTKALRVVFRVGFQVATGVASRLGAGGVQGYPAGVITPMA